MIISVCMATYNGGRYLKEQMDSILNQDLSAYPDAELEIIVSDDGSTDDTISILESYKDERIKVYHHKCHKRHRYNKAAYACTENFGFAMEKATGDFVFLSDQDDIWYPWKIEKQLTALLSNGGGISACAFDCGYRPEKIYGKEAYEPLRGFRLKPKYRFYGFSICVARSELKYIMPMPDIPYHDNFITYVEIFRNQLHEKNIIRESCAFHRFTGQHNVSNIKNETPFINCNYQRIKLLFIAFCRSMQK